MNITRENASLPREQGRMDPSKEELLSQNDRARRFFEEIQNLKRDLNTLKDTEVLPAPHASGANEQAPAAQAAVPAEAEEAAQAAETAQVAEVETAAGQTVPETAVESVPAEAIAAAVVAAAQTAAPDATAEPERRVTEPEPQATEPAAVETAEATVEPAQQGAEVTAIEVTATETPATEAAADAAGPAEAAEAVAEPAAAVDPAGLSRPDASETFETRFRQQMENQIQAVQEEEETRAKAKAAKAARREAYRREKQARDKERREERRAKAKKKQQERALRAEIRRKKRIADKSAEMGGGIVNAHDTTVSTEIQPVAKFSWRDLLGIVPHHEKRAAATEEELQALKEEQEKKTAEARQVASQLSKVRATRYRNSAFGQRAEAFKKFCERHKTLLLTGLSMVLLVCVGAAGVINYCTIYEYSYNGHSLGYVKSKDQVLQITDMVQHALTEDKEMQVIIDPKDDITFQRVSTLDREVTPDSSEDVLRRLTYVGDLNVKAYGVYVNGKKAGAVRSKDVAAEVLKKIEDRYASDKEGTVIEKAQILETVDVRKGNNSLRQVYSADRMAEILCTSGRKETVHTVVAGETLNDIALMYGTTDERLIADNEGVDPTQLEVGSTLLIKQNAPLLTVRMVEKRDYTKTIKFETVTKKTDEMYEDEQEIQQEGKDGTESISERTVSINGEVEKRSVLSDVIIEKPVKKIVLVGTAERPPTVGDGVYIWPLAGGYSLTSNYGYRWGRLHAGIDLGTPVGNDVLAADGGIVVRAGYFGGYGYCVDIDHQNGQMTRYGHLSQILVSEGEGVYEGQHIAESGNTGRSTGAHLHFEIHVNGQTHDPLQDLP